CGENQQGLVLSLPAEASDSAVVAAGVEPAADSQCTLSRCIGSQVGLERQVWSVFHQPESENGSRNAKDHVMLSKLGFEIRLRKVATNGVHASLDGKQVVNSAIKRREVIIRIGRDEPRLAHRTIRGDERGNDVVSAGDSVKRRHRYLG